MSLDDGDLITTTDDPHAQLRYQPQAHDDTYDWTVYVHYPHPPKYIVNNHAPSFNDFLPEGDSVDAFRKGWAFHSAYRSENQARERLQEITVEDVARHYEHRVANVLINHGLHDLTQPQDKI